MRPDPSCASSMKLWPRSSISASSAFTWVWEHRFGEDFLLYAQVSRAGLTLHLSGHHRDAIPGVMVFARMRKVEAYQQELARKDYKHAKSGVADGPWGLVMTVTDPFSNRIRFCQDKPNA